MTDRPTNGPSNGKVTSALIGALEVKLNALLGKYDRLMDHPRDRSEIYVTSASIVALEVILNALIGKYDRLTD